MSTYKVSYNHQHLKMEKFLKSNFSVEGHFLVKKKNQNRTTFTSKNITHIFYKSSTKKAGSLNLLQFGAKSEVTCKS